MNWEWGKVIYGKQDVYIDTKPALELVTRYLKGSDYAQSLKKLDDKDFSYLWIRSNEKAKSFTFVCKLVVMSTITVKTAKRNTSATRLAIRQAVNEAYSKNDQGKTAAKTAAKKTVAKH